MTKKRKTKKTTTRRHSDRTKFDKVIGVHNELRSYTYRAIVITFRDDNRPKAYLHRIIAGCRTWSSFKEAFNHYRGLAEGSEKWTDFNVAQDGMTRDRASSRRALSELKRLTYAYLKKCNG